MLSLNNIHVTFNAGTPTEVRALSDINLKIADGEFVTVIGSNGAGKSTLLSVVVGTVKPERGSVHLDGEDVTAWSPHRRAMHVGRVFQEPRLGTCSSLSIEENLALAAARGKSRGLKGALGTRQNRKWLADQVAKLEIGLEDRMTQPVGTLSGGQRQAISLLMATLLPMKILVLDEHTAALDPGAAAKVLALSTEIAETRKLTTLMVTHSMRDALAVGHRTIMMDSGRIVLDFTEEERAKLTVQDLSSLFGRAIGKQLDDDKMMLA
ncbi:MULTISPECIES: ABC transporter ATP-binding protein [Afifella]|uniref:Putative ABC transport system ATP-binding protein n=1 Tax=Afifella marina DSM 2698 TaxID=1120955 RepID=A0A1G5N3R8_AFIMA|nr:MULTISPECIES: ATP-binding cassette domain-containing protein [Afifella]MBK1622382.1 ABC transporter ATP-binding protein [Afifella marina DSM 2698]MBK1626904.1 ABC transporter ATP-binding protein [Afifella marina]MBK5919166.1 ABC transporter ATP-binding protein [Afifella marina]MCT8267516.1 ATP-binding cassette domain-containing protein [Afifella sp. JA880]RAI21214.1 ABC transporter ATP-binding protein [Afifella marina DSM 2698]